MRISLSYALLTVKNADYHSVVTGPHQQNVFTKQTDNVL